MVPCRFAGQCSNRKCNQWMPGVKQDTGNAHEVVMTRADRMRHLSKPNVGPEWLRAKNGKIRSPTQAERTFVNKQHNGKGYQSTW